MSTNVKNVATPAAPAKGYKVPAHGGERLSFRGMEFAIRATGESTAGAFCMIEEINPVEVPLHIHTNADEYFLVLEGEHVFTVGDTEISAGPGDLVVGPRGVPHAQHRVVPRVGRILSIFSPAGMEQYFRDIAAADAAGTLGPEEMVRITEEHGAVWVQ